MSSDGFGTCPLPFGRYERVMLGHGSGGQLTGQLVQELILPAFRNPALEPLDDAAVLEIGDERVAFTTDGYVVTPRTFPGGDVGCLAVHGTVNDLAMMGARPVALSLSFVLEEGLPMEELRAVVASAAAAAERAGVPVVTGDTKVVEQGSADGVFVTTTGVGRIPRGRELGSRRVCPGDLVLVSGTLADHGATVLVQRLGLELEGDLRSDTAPLHGLVEALLEACPEVHALRDPTRGGLAATLVEIAERRKLGIRADEDTIPVRDAVRGACELLGLDPLQIANEGKLVAFVPERAAARALDALRAHPLGRDAAIVGRVVEDHPGTVVLRTPIGGERVLDLPFAEPLPRIC